MDRKEILETAEKMVNGARQDDYGRPERSFEMIAALWTIYLNTTRKLTGLKTKIDTNNTGTKQEVKPIYSDLTPQDVAAMMILLKIARVAGGHGKSDNWIDIAGYAACGGELDKPSLISSPAASDGCWLEKAKEVCRPHIEKAAREAVEKATQEKGVDWNRLAADLHRSVDAIAEMCRKAGGKE